MNTEENKVIWGKPQTTYVTIQDHTSNVFYSLFLKPRGYDIYVVIEHLIAAINS